MPIPIVERSEHELARIITRRVRDAQGVQSCRWVRVDMTGKKPIVTVLVWLAPQTGSEGSHKVSLEIERQVKDVIPNSRVLIRTEPMGEDRDVIWKLVKDTADSVPGSRGAHNIHIFKSNGSLGVDFHLEVSANMTVKQAAKVGEQIEKKLKAANPTITSVMIHQESVSDLVSSEMSGAGTEIRWYIEHVGKRYPEIRSIEKPIVRLAGDKLYVVVKCKFDPNISMQKVDEICSSFETAVKVGVPEILHIDIDKEPA